MPVTSRRKGRPIALSHMQFIAMPPNPSLNADVRTRGFARAAGRRLTLFVKRQELRRTNEKQIMPSLARFLRWTRNELVHTTNRKQHCAGA